MTIMGRLLSSTASGKRLQTEKKIQIHRSDRLHFRWRQKKSDDIFIRFDTITACYRDRQPRYNNSSRADA